MVRRLVIACLVLAFVVLSTSYLAAMESVRIRDLKEGQSATIKARVGQRVESEETAGYRAFTVRDDYGDMVLGRTTDDISRIRFGATYYLTGRLVSGSEGTSYFDIASWRIAYGIPLAYILIPLAVALLIGVAIFLVTGRRIKAVQPDPVWDYVEVVSGPDQGGVFELKGDRVVVGRKQGPDVTVRLLLDKYVSREHGVLVREGGKTYYEDTGSSQGSWVEEQKVEPGTRALVPPGAYIRLGPHTVLRVGRPADDDANNKTRSFDDSSSKAGNWAEQMTKTDSGGSSADSP